jgi:DNA modification methylase
LLTLPKILDMEVKEPLFEYVSAKYNARIECGASKLSLQGMVPGKFDLIMTSPPYNVGKSYEVKQSTVDSIRSRKTKNEKRYTKNDTRKTKK